MSPQAVCHQRPFQELSERHVPGDPVRAAPEPSVDYAALLARQAAAHHLQRVSLEGLHLRAHTQQKLVGMQNTGRRGRGSAKGRAVIRFRAYILKT